jgi:hypothetical protein
MRRLAFSWFLVVVPRQACSQPSLQSVGSMSRMFCGVFVSNDQSSAGVERMSDCGSTRHHVGTLLSKTLAILAQKTRNRVLSASAFVPAERPAPVDRARSLAVSAYVPQVAPPAVAP